MTLVPQILVVEDDPTFRSLLVARLEALGAATVVAADVGDAILALEHEEFDLVLTDHELPHGSGLDVLAYAAHRFPALPRVLMSGIVDEQRPAEPLADEVYDKTDVLGALPQLVRQPALSL